MADYIAGYTTVKIGIWAKKSGVWSKITTRNVPVSGATGTSATTTKTTTVTDTFQLGTGVQAFGITFDDAGPSGSSGSLNDFIQAAWTNTSTSGTRTATPSGKKGKIKIIPQ